MKYINYTLALGAMILVVILIAYFVPKVANSPQTTDNNQSAVKDFDSCAAKYPVMESYPAKCTDPTTNTTYTQTVAQGDVVISTPAYGQVVTSPLIISGKARGNWFFEANLPVTLKDSNGKVLAKKGFHADGDWMTTDYVNFTGTLEFTTPETDLGLLVIENDNPSGLPENDKSFALPIKFK